MTSFKNNELKSPQNQPVNDSLVVNPELTPIDAKKEKQIIDLDTSKFEKNVVLKQSSHWSRATIWTIMGVATFVVVWAAIAKIEQVVPARGQLKPKGTVKEIQAPINGVVKKVNVKDGDLIDEGDTLVVFDSEATQAELQSLQKIRASLIQENKFYRTLMDSSLTSSQIEKAMVDLKLPPEVQALAVNRTSLVEENKLYGIELDGKASTTGLKPDEISRIKASRNELNSRAASAELEIDQLERQFNQNESKLKDAKAMLLNDRQVLAEIKKRNQLSINQAKESLKIEQDILKSVAPLAEEGALAKTQIQKQKQQVQDRQRDLIDSQANGKIEADNQQQQITTRLAEIEQLEEEQSRISLDIAQAQEQLNNTLAVSQKDVTVRIADNNKRLAEIDSQINKIIIENEKRIAETNSQIRGAEQTIKYQEIKAPVSGTVFDLKAGPGFVPKSGQSEALLKIVPEAGIDNPLIGEVYVTNEDIGFVKLDQITDVRIDSFPYSEFGDIKGKVYLIGSDALPPDQIHNFYRFPVKVELDQQYLSGNDGKKIELQSGMSISVNIKVKENRTVLSLFTELFTKKVDSLKNVR